MIEIIVLIFLARDIGKLAASKGLKPSTWQIYLVISWIFTEMTGILLGVMLFGRDNIVTVFLIAIGFAFSSYFLLYSRLNKYPDHWDDEVNNIGKNR